MLPCILQHRHAVARPRPMLRLNLHVAELDHGPPWFGQAGRLGAHQSKRGIRTSTAHTNTSSRASLGAILASCSGSVKRQADRPDGVSERRAATVGGDGCFRGLSRPAQGAAALGSGGAGPGLCLERQKPRRARILGGREVTRPTSWCAGWDLPSASRPLTPRRMTAGSWRVAIRRRRPPQRGLSQARAHDAPGVPRPGHPPPDPPHARPRDQVQAPPADTGGAIPDSRTITPEMRNSCTDHRKLYE